VKSSAQVVVIGGGVVGASVLYHLTEAGWHDVVLVERKVLSAGSTWHSAGGMHTLNGDPNVSKLQQYTIELYRTIEARSGQDCSIHLPGGLMLANDRERLDWLRMAQARGRYLGMELQIITAAEAKEMFPLLEEQYFVGALFDPVEGHVDPSGVTNAYALCARQAGAEVYRHTWVEDLRQRPDGSWEVVTDRGEIHAEHIVNAGGLWAREVGRMIGLELPVLGMEHMYLVTDDMGRSPPTPPSGGTRCRWRSTSRARSTSARSRAGCSWGRTSRRACRGRQTSPPGASTRSCSRRTSTASLPRWRSPSSTTRRWRRPGSSA
jgi:dimethylglycine dehydrogenase